MENYDEEEVQEVEVDDGKKRKIPLRSNVWAHFTKLPCGNKGKCHHCRKTFAANRGNTTNLKNHLDRCRSYQDVKVEGDPKQQVNMLLFVANVLDPRCKLEFVTFCFSSMYESRKVKELKSNIKELLMKLYNSYIGGSDVRSSGGVCFGDIHDGGGGGGSGGASSSIMSIDLFHLSK
ncbi:hypothetical protein WN944_006681 [Citrus x changshan-huyou]|uniref:BED-type domain-containing protein n=1 Tax=Citrus x changshan-huyou TaxID=2935761 RepID=A0AAP0QXD9_9ROSI